MTEKWMTSPLRALITYEGAYALLEEIYGNMCSSDADYEERYYYKIVELKDWCTYKQASSSYLHWDF